MNKLIGGCFCIMAAMAIFALGCGSKSKPVCGDGKLQGDEICDLEDLGGQTCQGLGHDGGELFCTDQCTLDDSGCHDCGASDPCTGRDCGPGEGTCRLYDCQPYCDCAEGNVIGRGLTCHPADYCKSLGEECSRSIDCCRGTCVPFGDGVDRCKQNDCLGDFQCTYAGEGDYQGCCFEYETGDPEDPLASTCIVPLEGQPCGDRTGTCGADCSSGSHSDCSPLLICMQYSLEDPNSHCVPACETDADCTDCSSEHLPDISFVCSSFSGISFCRPVWPACATTTDCPDDFACTFLVDPDGNIVQACQHGGETPTGGHCDPLAEYSSTPWEQRCLGLQCWGYHCTQACLTDADCPQEMTCAHLPDSEIHWCQWSPGSGDACQRNADCPAEEVCVSLIDDQGAYYTGCRTRHCDPAADDCQATGEPLGAGLPPCWTGVVGSWHDGPYCWEACATTDDCPAGMVCFGQTNLAEDFVLGGCVPFDGSAATCQRDADCQALEVCTYFQGIEGWEGLCATAQGDGLLGDDCVNSNDCATGVCWDHPDSDFCSAICAQDDDCADGFICIRWTFSEDSDDFGGACYRPGSSATPCDYNGDCPDGESCQFITQVDGISGYCMATGGQSEQGDACAQHGECANNFCWPQYGCLDLCTEDAHCQAGSICQGFTFQGETKVNTACIPFEGSAQACGRDADCAGVEVCRIVARAHDGVNTYDYLCGLPFDPGVSAGGNCAMAACYNGLCLTDHIDTFCSQACQVDGDCLADHYCSKFVQDEVEPILGGTCWPIDGSLAACTSDTDCADSDEVCGFYLPLGQPVGGLCTTPLDGGGPAGDPCDENADCASRTCTGVDEACTAYCETNADCQDLALACSAFLLYGLEMTGCQPPGPNHPLCTFCALDADCGQDAVCVTSQVNPGEHYCGLPCPTGTECPDGYTCTDVGAAVENCVPDTDTCLEW